MEIKYIKDFIVLSKTMNYLEAAEELFISQSSLTRHIQKMEEELGFPLFIRTSRKVSLSESGEAFLPYAAKIVDTYEKYTTDLLVGSRRSKKVIIGCNKALAPYDLGIILSQFRADNPDIDVEFIQPVKQFEMLRADLLDFLLTGCEFIPKGEFNVSAALQDNFVAVVSSKHPFAERESITLSELAGERLALPSTLLLPDSSFTLACRQLGVSMDCDVADNNEIIDLAAIGGYTTIMPKKIARYFADPSVSLIDISPEIMTEMSLVYRKSPPLTSIERWFLDYLLQALHKLS